jgi:hypothetical protein
MDHGYGKWVLGAAMAVLSFVGLLMASRAADAAFYWTGMTLFLFGVLFIFALIGQAYRPPRDRERGEETRS